MLIKQVEDSAGNVIAHVYDTKNTDKTIFATPDYFPLQFSVGVNAEGKTFAPHVHLPVERSLVGTGEFILVTAGRMDIEFLDDDARIIDKVSLKPGMAILQVGGGHAIRTIDGTRFIEVKQGPYSGVAADKKIVEPHI
jgi:hypothetical protein